MPQSVRRSPLLRSLLLAALVLLSSSSCLEWDRTTSNEIRDVTRFVAAVRTLDGVAAVFHAGNAPTGGPAGTVSAEFPPLVLKGGSARVVLNASEPFSRLIVAADGHLGYWELTLPAATTTVAVLILYAQDVGASAFDLRYAAGAGTVLSAYREAPTAFLGNGTGEIQVNITWNSRADIDLYVVDPLGAEIYHAARQSTSGGELDIDANAACHEDGARAESVFWPSDMVPPRGEYVVRVNAWSNCGAPATDYVVTIRTKDGVPQTYTGRLTGSGNGRAAGAGQHVGVFRY